jgi:glutathione S-transferase
MNDSWPVALYLDKAFPAPEYPPLFPSEGSQALALAVQQIVNGCMGKTSPILIPKVPLNILDDRDQEYFNRTRSSPQMYGKPLSEVLAKGEALEKAWKALLNDLRLLASMLGANDKGPFFEGTKPGYADFLVVSFVAWYERVDRADFERIMGAGNGELKRLWDACLPWVNGQGVEKEYGASKI